MANWEKKKITNIGREKLAKAYAESKNITFTKCKTSSRDYSNETLELLTELTDIKQETNITGKQVENGTVVKLSSNIKNDNLTESYDLRTYGIYANIGDGEFLFAVACDSSPDNVPLPSATTWQCIINDRITVDNTDNIKIEYNPAADATIEYVDNQIDNVSKRIICDYTEESTTTLNTNHPASKNEVGKKAYVKDTNTVYKCIYDESSKTYKWVVDSSADNIVIASKDYVVEQSNATLTSAKSYSDTNLTTAKSYSDTKLTEAKNYSNTNLATAKTYSDTNLKTAKSYSDTNLATAKTYTDNNIPKLYNGSTSSKISNHKGVIIVSGTTAPTTTTCALGYSYETYSS